jgi:serine/threonine protein kinase
MIGQRLGHYRIVEKIAAGRMVEVYRSHDEQLDRDVALKVLHLGMLRDKPARKQFHKEVVTLAKLNHPNIETVFEFGTQDRVDYLIMELIPGTALSEWLKGGPLPEEETVRLGTQIAHGLVAAHEQGVVHRDLKPGNLMVTPDGRLKILDFGLARLLRPTQAVDVRQSITADTGTLTGTVPYMSPEQLRGEHADARSDIYAAGAVLYEAATGRRPFPQTHGPTLVGAILNQKPEPPSSVNRQLTLGIGTVILKALEKERQARYQSAAELRAALETLSATRVGIEAIL